ncbi:MAG: hypothetical protein COA47_03520 [Robiginitomaculum sp.]|nr:MAG: hypothetical protein COA47_03520 [Robiginitomaculum sp.]
MYKRIPLAITTAIVSGALLLPVSATAQDALKKRENVSYYRVVNFDFKPGHNDAAWEILYDKIAPAVRSMDKEFVALDWDSGPWDSTVYIVLEEGYGTLEYSDSPQGAAFMEALAKQEGGKEAAEKVMKDWVSHIARDSQDLAHAHLPPPAKTK